MINHIGIIAGNGSFPLVCAQAARGKNIRVTVIAIRQETDPAIEQCADNVHWVDVGNLSGLMQVLATGGFKQVIMAGQVRPKHLFDQGVQMDAQLAALLGDLRDKKADSIFQALCGKLQSIGMEIVDSTIFLKDDLPSKGVLAGNDLTEEESATIHFGYRIAKEVARLDIGLTVVVKDMAIVAVEALEGTDETIRRGGRIGKAGCAVIKVARPAQDMRVDIPVVGLTTIEVLKEMRASLLVIEADKTLILDKEEFFAIAKDANIKVVAYTE